MKQNLVMCHIKQEFHRRRPYDVYTLFNISRQDSHLVQVPACKIHALSH